MGVPYLKDIKTYREKYCSYSPNRIEVGVVAEAEGGSGAQACLTLISQVSSSWEIVNLAGSLETRDARADSSLAKKGVAEASERWHRGGVAG